MDVPLNAGPDDSGIFCSGEKTDACGLYGQWPGMLGGDGESPFCLPYLIEGYISQKFQGDVHVFRREPFDALVDALVDVWVDVLVDVQVDVRAAFFQSILEIENGGNDLVRQRQGDETSNSFFGDGVSHVRL